MLSNNLNLDFYNKARPKI